MKKYALTIKELENTNGEGGVEIHIPSAIGDPTDTNNCPIFIEKYEGEVRVCIWNGEEDPTIIPIKMKKKKKRESAKPINNAIECIMRLYLGAKPVDPQDSWHNLHLLQGYRDSLEALKREGVIKDYNLHTGEITYE